MVQLDVGSGRPKPVFCLTFGFELLPAGQSHAPRGMTLPANSREAREQEGPVALGKQIALPPA
jgi:hypothetical protein